MDTHIERVMNANSDTVYRLAAAVEDWPRILPHYRWVRVLETAPDGRRTVEMAARRDVLGPAWSGIPLHWTALQTLDPIEPRISFEHIAGVTRGMHVAWTFTPAPDGALRVAIRHVFEPAWPVPAVLVRLILGEYFVNGVAARTLRRIGELAERSC
jgi:ribosome-associated toxin RatA of RatAB toxin-antitoxin module